MRITHRTARVVMVAAMMSVAIGGSAAAQTIVPVSKEAEQRTQRYQIGTIERVLENAVEHGASVVRARLQALIPSDMLLSAQAQARGFRLEGYGVFFDVVVPNLEGTMPWAYRTMDQNDLGLENALTTLRKMVEAQKGDPDLQQALKRVELQVAPYSTSSTAGAGTGATQAATSRPAGSTDPILNNPEEAYRAEVIDALMYAMLNHSRGLNLMPGEWLTVGARRDDSRLSVGETPARTIQISIGADDLRGF